tara:strand:- start:431 stop:1135 length:705 start_codon:yes stop_codon:yes gene_type:complete
VKNLLTRGGIEFIAVLLGISISLWIEKNNQASELNDKIEEVHNIVLAEVSELIKYTDSRLERYNILNNNIDFLFDNWDSFSIKNVENPSDFSITIWSTTSMQFRPNLSTLQTLKNDGRFNLIDEKVRKIFGSFYTQLERINRLQNKEDDVKERLLRYLSEKHSEAIYEHPINFNLGANQDLTSQNFMVVIERTRSDRAIFGFLGRKCSLAKFRNFGVIDMKNKLEKIEQKLKDY